jgi:hypothetical protein
MFEDVADLFQQYAARLEARQAVFNGDLVIELHERLRQLDFILYRVRVLEPAAGFAQNRAHSILIAHAEQLKRRGMDFRDDPYPRGLNSLTRKEFEASSAARFELKLLTEAFYYFAERVRSILKKDKRARPKIPGLEAFDCEGVRNVRNHLLEHPEGATSQIWSPSFGFGGSSGPCLKPSRSESTAGRLLDQGLYANAEEFRRNLDAVLRRAICDTTSQR